MNTLELKMSQNESWWFRWRAEAIYIALIPLGLMVVFSKPFALSEVVELLLNILAWICFAVGTSLRFWALLYIGGRKRRSLVDTGPYSICRNPLYVGTLFHSLALCLFLKSIIFSLGVGVASLIFVLSVVPTEEKYLIEKLGDVYAVYCKRVPRYLFRFSSYMAAESIEVWLKPVQREFWRACFSTFWIPITAIVVSYLQSLSWWPKLPWML